MNFILIIISFFPVVRSGTNDFCPCLTKACPTFADIPYYPLSPSWSFLFEETPNIYNSGTEGSLILSLGINGKNVLIPERKGSVIYCSSWNNCLNPTVLSLPDSICASDLTQCKNGGFTFSFWVKIGINQKNGQFEIIDYVEQGMAIYYQTDSDRWIIVASQGTYSGVVTFSGNNAERWHHIVGVAYSSLYVSAFLDGKLMGNQTMIGGLKLFNKVAPRFFNLWKGAERYWVDDFKMWSVPLTADQIQQNYIDESTSCTNTDCER